MSTNELDIQYDEAMYDLYKSNIQDFKDERFKEYFIENPKCHKVTFNTLNEACRFYKMNEYGPALIYSFSSIEMIFRDLLVLPMLSGLIIDFEMADFITQNVFGTRNHINENMKKFIFKFVKDKVDVDVNRDKIENHNDPIWKEFTIIRDCRNKHIHNGLEVMKENAELSIELAEYLFKNIFQGLIKRCDLEINEFDIIQNK